MKKRVLWIEDQAFSDLPAFAGPVYMTGKYELVVATTASEGIRHIMHSQFDAVIVDIRLPPGEEKVWKELYSARGESKASARLGLEMLQALLRPAMSSVKLEQPIPRWVVSTPTRFGVMTVESPSEIEKELQAMGISVYRQKKAHTEAGVLLEMIIEILHQDAGPTV